MTQNSIPNNERTVTLTDFLGALYPQPPAELWLELRCIYPETGEVCTLWMYIGNGKRREAVLNKSARLNGEGFGAYFAPCLQRERKGNAASAALLPALWGDIDCHGDPAKREKGLAKLREFDPQRCVIRGPHFTCLRCTSRSN